MSGLLTRAEVAEKLRVSERTLRRTLATMPGLGCIKVGRTVLFRQADVARIERELTCPYTIDCAAKSTTSGAQSDGAERRSKSPSTLQAAALSEMRRLREKQKQQKSEHRSRLAARSSTPSP